ncbi:MAG: hypothetical protein ACR2J3_08810, partial [Aridibacter sp.]
MSPDSDIKQEKILRECEDLMKSLYARCVENTPNFGVAEECFKNSLKNSIQKYLFRNPSDNPTIDEAKNFIESIQLDDLFLAMACANGNERAWWEFDQQHRSYL